MDNLEQNEAAPTGVEDVTSSSGQPTSPEPQTAESTGADDEGTKEEAGSKFPWEDDPHFKGKTPEEMYGIVKESNEYKGKLSQKAKVADMIYQKFGLTPEQIEQNLQQQETAQKEAYYRENPTAALAEEVQNLKTSMIFQTETAKLEKFIQANPQYEPYKNQIMEAAVYMPSMTSKDYKDIASTLFGNAINQGKEQAYNKIETKTKTQASGVSKSAPNKQVTLDDMKNMPTEELKQYLTRA